MTKDPKKNKDRLQEIAEVNLGELSDEDVLELLAERKQLEELEKELEEEYKRVQEKQAQVALLEKEKATTENKLTEINKLISPDKPDEELLELIQQRKELEAELETETTGITSLKQGGSGAASPQKKDDAGAKIELEEEKAPKKEVVPEPIVSKPEPKEEIVVSPPVAEPPKPTEPILKLKPTEEFGREAIGSVGLSEHSEWQKYLERLKSSPASMGSILDNLPKEAKKNKEFMLEVAKVDPAYAMHYADKDTLKRDEDFNVRIAGMKNDRNSGNPLAEMLPEARTSQVVLTAMKQDYENVRFALPNMSDYDAMLTIAKKGALEKIKKLKDGVDVTLLIPKVLRKDRAFMEEVEKITGKDKE